MSLKFQLTRPRQGEFCVEYSGFCSCASRNSNTAEHSRAARRQGVGFAQRGGEAGRVDTLLCKIRRLMCLLVLSFLWSFVFFGVEIFREMG